MATGSVDGETPIDDTDRESLVQQGYSTIRVVARETQQHARILLIVFAIGLFGGFSVLRYVVWDTVQNDVVYSQMGPETARATNIVVTDPFNAILLQSKYGFLFAIILTVLVAVYQARNVLQSVLGAVDVQISRNQAVLVAASSFACFVGGLAYGYHIFFPVAFDFLAGFALDSGFQVTWSLVKWTDFFFTLLLSFGLAAQLPVIMVTTSLTGLVSYETYRNRWRAAVLVIFAFGAAFSPPDPFTQLMWAFPLLVLYAGSLVVTRVLLVVDVLDTMRSTGSVLEDSFGRVVLVPYTFGQVVLAATITQLTTVSVTGISIPGIGTVAQTSQSDTLLGAFVQPVQLSLAVTLTSFVLILGYYRLRPVLFYAFTHSVDDTQSDNPVSRTYSADKLSILDAEQLSLFPLERLVMYDSETIADASEQLLAADRPEAAEILISRYKDAMEKFDESDSVYPAQTGGNPGGSNKSLPGDDLSETDNGSVSTRREVWNIVVDSVVPFRSPDKSVSEPTETDFTPLYRDAGFLLGALLSRATVLFSVFSFVFLSVFLFFYQGGTGTIVDFFTAQLGSTQQSQVNIVVLHPVEELIFILKFAIVSGALVTALVSLYLIWPQLVQRGFITVSRSFLGLGTLLILLGGIYGVYVGFVVLTPIVISTLAGDALTSNMIIAYRIRSFGWVVAYVTAGVGLLFTVPTILYYTVAAGVLRYPQLRSVLRQVVFGIFVAAAFIVPFEGILGLLIVAVPLTAVLCIAVSPLEIQYQFRRRLLPFFR